MKIFNKRIFTHGEKRQCRLHTGEANEVRAKTEASTLAGRDRDRGCECVKEGKCDEGRRADREDLTEVGLLGVKNKNRNEGND